LLRYAEETSWLEDKRRVSNGDPVPTITAFATARGRLMSAATGTFLPAEATDSIFLRWNRKYNLEKQEDGTDQHADTGHESGRE
jgi:hypothetical protein